MSINIEKAHPYIRAWFHAANAERKKWSEIESNLGTYCPEIEDLIQLENDVDLAYIMKYPNAVTLAISGTRDWDGWKRNFQINENDGWHRGFRESFDNMIKKPLDHALRNWPGKVWILAHSAGPAIGLNAAYYIRKWLKRNCELIGLCAPQAVNAKGAAQCSKEHVCATMLQIDRHDQVDNMMKWLRGLNARDYGMIRYLPNLKGLPGALDNPIADMFFGGHAPSYVNKCLQKMYINWGRPDWKEQVEYLQAVMEVAIK